MSFSVLSCFADTTIVSLLVDFETKTAAGFAQSVERWPAEQELRV